MFQQAREALVVGGALYIVGNRHLGYHSKLARFVPGGGASGGNAQVRYPEGPQVSLYRPFRRQASSHRYSTAFRAVTYL
ncbi:protein RsmC [Pseudomonas putida S11]|nr:protein RsmC [Pseudomonas putida S11]